MIASATVDGSDPLSGFYRYASIPVTTLLAGENYIIGAYDYTLDDAIRSDLGGLDLSIDPSISIVTGRWLPSTSLTFPTNTINSAIYYPTATFQFTAVPEPPSAIVLVVTAIAMRRRQRRIR